MDLEKNIEIAAEVYFHNHIEDTSLPDTDAFVEMYIEGAKSQAAKDYWYNEFKAELWKDNFQKSILTNKPMKPSECFNGKSEHQMIFGTGDGLTDQEKLDIEYGITPLGRQHRQYLKDNPDKPMSFNDWKYMIENYKGESSNIIHKHIGVIGHVDHGKSIKCVIVGSQMLIPEERFEVMENLKPDLSAIKSIVPIADVIPEEIISKQEFLEMHDKAVERSITEETYRESRAWDIKKEKKVSHKRNNKRRK